MKNIFLLITMIMFTNHLFATHYSQAGNINNTTSVYKIHDKKIIKLELNKEPKLFYEFYSDCSGLKDEESGLAVTGTEQFIGASGRTHIISDLFAKYEKRALSMRNDYHFVSNHDTDVFVVFDKKGEDFTIDIFTGEDAVKQRNDLKK